MQKHIAITFVLSLALCFSINAQHCVSQRYSEVAVFDSAEIVLVQNIQYGSAEQYFTGQETPLLMDVYYPDLNVDDMEERPFILNIHANSILSLPATTR